MLYNLFAYILLSPVLLAIIFIPAIQYKRGGVWQVFYIVTIPALFLDVLLNYTSLALLTWDWPQDKEYTFSRRLSRLNTYSTWKGKVARMVTSYLNAIDPTGKHIA